MIKKITLILLMFIWFLPFLIMLLIAFNSQNTLSFSEFKKVIIVTNNATGLIIGKMIWINIALPVAPSKLAASIIDVETNLKLAIQ